MATKDADLSSLRIDRSSQGVGKPKKSPTLRKTVFWLAVVALSVLAYLFTKDRLNPGIEVQLVGVSLTSPSQASSVLTASGYVVARRKAAVSSKGTGRLVYLGVEEGDKVKKGQVLARLDDSDVIAARERVRGELRAAEAELNDAKENLNRARILLERQLVAQADYDGADARYKRVVATIEAAQFALKEAEIAVEFTRIIAPFDGTVLKKNADVGEIIAPLAGAASSRGAVATIADMASLEVDADVSEANITRVTADQECEIRLDAYPDTRYAGYVSKVVPTADRAKATVLVKIKFRKYDDKVLPEMSAKIAFLAPGARREAASAAPLLTVPAAAVAQRDGQAVVFQVRDNRAVALPVVVGQTVSSLVEIKSGLKAGDKVIGKVDEKIHAGAKVMLKGQ